MRLLSLSFTLVLVLAVVSGEGEYKSDDDSVELTLPLSCREVIFKEARDPVSCAMVPQSALVYDEEEEEDGWEIPNPRSHDDEPTEPEPEITETFVWSPGTQMWIKTPPGYANVNDMPGSCRWDFHRASVYTTDQACLCPATKGTCGKEAKCWWYEVPDAQSKVFPKFACLNNAERFYYLLQKLLKKRGKNDFAIKINYGASPYNPNPFTSMDGGLLQKIMMMRMMSQMMQGNSGGSSYTNNYSQGYYYTPVDSSSSSNYNQGYLSNSNTYNGYGYGSSNYNYNYDGYYNQSSNPSYNYNSYYPASSASSYNNQEYYMNGA